MHQLFFVDKVCDPLLRFITDFYCLCRINIVMSYKLMWNIYWGHFFLRINITRKNDWVFINWMKIFLNLFNIFNKYFTLQKLCNNLDKQPKKNLWKLILFTFFQVSTLDFSNVFLSTTLSLTYFAYPSSLYIFCTQTSLRALPFTFHPPAVVVDIAFVLFLSSCIWRYESFHLSQKKREISAIYY